MKKKLANTLSILLCANILGTFTACNIAGQPTDQPTEILTTTEAPAEPKIVLLEIAKQPDKLVYAPGEQFDPTGLVVNAVLDDGSVIKNVKYTADTTALRYYSKSASVTYKGKTLYVPIEIYLAGNEDEYDVKHVKTLEDSPLADMTYYFLGSSVTYGEGAEGQSMADFLAKKHGCTVIKNAVSGTTLRVQGKNSYLTRLQKDISEGKMPARLDAFICQLSTNDKTQPEKHGTVTANDVRDIDAFNTETTFGAIETIITIVRSMYDCPVVFYTNSYFKDANYQKLVEGLDLIQKKYDIQVLDLYRDEAFNQISKEDYALYMRDDIHPMKVGYRDWWLPAFENFLISLK